jgi:hypothetical protein
VTGVAAGKGDPFAAGDPGIFAGTMGGRGGAVGVGVAIAPATGACTLPRGGALGADGRAGSRAAGGVGGGDSAAFVGGFTGSAGRVDGGAGGEADEDFGAGALGGAVGGDSALPSSPRLRSREKMLMLPPTQTSFIDLWHGRL